MKIIVACNAFKGSLTSMQAGRAIARGFRKAMPHAEFIEVPIADGGDGTLDCIRASVPAKKVRKKVPGPLGEPIMGDYLLTQNGQTAVIEMARASGLAMIQSARPDPMNATALGTGLLIRDAVERGCRSIIVGIGGSATNEGGMGPAVAAGFKFLDSRGNELAPVGKSLKKIRSIDTAGIRPEYSRVEITVACDVTNPLLGPSGAAAVYAPQKGASPAQVKQLEAGLKQLADTAVRDLGKDLRNVPGTGAAGGMGFGLMTFLNARLVSGIDMLIQATQLDKKMEEAHLLITGEGRMDAQSVQGKAPFGLLKLAKKHSVPVIALCGSLEDEAELYRRGFRGVFPITPGPVSLEEAMQNAGRLLERTATRVAGILCLEIGK